MTLQLKPNTYYRTRDDSKMYVIGRVPDEVITHYPTYYPWLGVGVDGDLMGDKNCWADDGRFDRNRQHAYDIVAEWHDPIKIEKWVNICQNGNVFVYDSRDTADMRATQNRIACIKLTATEGDGLEETKTKTEAPPQILTTTA